MDILTVLDDAGVVLDDAKSVWTYNFVFSFISVYTRKSVVLHTFLKLNCLELHREATGAYTEEPMPGLADFDDNNSSPGLADCDDNSSFSD